MLTDAEKRTQRNRRYQNSFGISLAEYNERDRQQKHRCRICGKPPKAGGKPLHVEHDHVIARSRVVVAGRRNVWQAFIPEFLKQFDGTTRIEVAKAAKRWLLRKSVRGLCCWGCNQLLKAANDDSAKCYAAGKYLDSFLAGLYND